MHAFNFTKLCNKFENLNGINFPAFNEGDMDEKMYVFYRESSPKLKTKSKRNWTILLDNQKGGKLFTKTGKKEKLELKRKAFKP